MRKAFLRTPVEFARISSRFSLGRKHPILNKIRAHKGVDYAASTGTPVRAAGDGVIKLAARKGGYGRAIIIQHGGRYTTLYGHLSRYARSIKRGKHVKQGQIIGYVGMTGLATGPHLHYEFRVNGVHRNPLTVKLPKAMRIPDDLMDEFKTQTEPLLAQLNGITNNTTVAAGDDQVQTIIALNEQGPSSSHPN
jgi:murein DD-endopeptidase MepM/ murein hydrolase activator NlpD